MNMRRWAWLLFLTCAAAILWSDRAVAGVALTSSIWLLAAVSDETLRLPRGTGAWTAWVIWCAFSLILSRQPLAGLGAWWVEATAVSGLVLAFTWWRDPQRRALTGWLIAGGALAAACAVLRVSWIPGPVLACVSVVIAAVASASDGVSMPIRVFSAAAALLGGGLMVLFGWQHVLTPTLAAAAAAIGLTSSGAYGRFLAAALGAAAAGLVLRDGTAAAVVGQWMAAFKSSSAAGVGPGQAVYLRAGSSSIPARVLLEVGWIGALLYFGAFVDSFPRKLSAQSVWRRLAAGAYLALAFLSLTDATMAAPALRVLTFVALAAASGFRPERDDSSADVAGFREWTKPRWASAFCAAACACAWLPTWALSSGERMASSSDPVRRLAGLRRRLSVAPFDPKENFRLAMAYARERPPRLGAALDYLDQAIDADPENAAFLGYRAELFGAFGDWERAERAAERALALAPEFVDGHLILAEAALGRGDRRRAAEESARALELSLASAERGAGGVLNLLDKGRYERVRAALESRGR
ncbi:MAG: hypothetical protein HY078_08065 [Elusimicrobia bacterium]|nr:hypothetical protein [Elusimicrobiota bacterium]